MTPEHIRLLQENEAIRKRLAKVMALRCFRNTEIENLHSGGVPQSVAGDYSDVHVVTPSQGIAWKDVSRFNDAEMNTLMIDVVNQCAAFLDLLYSDRRGDLLIDALKKEDLIPEWNDPENAVPFRPPDDTP